MTESPYENSAYQQWLAERRAAIAPATLADQIMSHVAQLERQRQGIWWLAVVQRIERSRAARWAVCAGALAVGCLPFIVLAYVAQVVAF